MRTTRSLFRLPTKEILAAILAMTTGGSLGCGPAESLGAGDPETETVSQALTVTPQDPVVVGYDDLNVYVPTRFNVPYTGAAAAAFPDGLPLSIGSGLRFRRGGPLGISFYGLTDRGPNTDAPTYLDAAGVSHPSKAFLSPAFTPEIVFIDVLPFFGPIVTRTLPLRFGRTPATGLALTGATTEVALSAETLAALPPSDTGVDSEAIDVDRHGNIWIGEEMGPSILKVSATTGQVIARLMPGVELPAILGSRQVNRGFEGLAVTPNGKIYALVQSTLDIAAKTKGKAQFIRLVEYDPVTGATRMFAYPHDVAQYAKSGDAKLGDLFAVDNNRFLLIEQGKDKDKKLRNLVYAIDLSGATDLTGKLLTGGSNAGLDLEYGTAEEIAAQLVVVKKSLLVDLRAYGWTDEKSEGLSLVDDQTLVVSNDQDFGATATITGDPTSTDPTDYVVDSTGALTIKGVPSSGTYEVHAAAPEAQRSHLFALRLAKPVTSYFPR
jgi:hypothetical protein